MEGSPKSQKEYSIPVVLFLAAFLFLILAAHPGIWHLYSYPPQPRSAFLVYPLANLVMKALVSLGFGAVSLYIILSDKHPAKDKHWAYGTAGLIIGFWLR